MTSETKEKKDGKNGQDKSNRHVTPLNTAVLCFRRKGWGDNSNIATAIGKGCNMQTQGICGVYLCKCILVMLIHSSQMCNSKYMNLKVNY